MKIWITFFAIPLIVLAVFGIEDDSEFFNNVEYKTDNQAIIGQQTASLGIMVSHNAMLVTVSGVLFAIVTIMYYGVTKQ